MSRHARAFLAAAAAIACLVPVSAPRAARAADGPALTIYSHDLAYVRESRKLERAAGDTVRIGDLPDRLDFSSLRLEAAGYVRFTDVSRRQAPGAGDALIEASRGAKVRVTMRDDRMVEGTLASADDAWIVVRGADGALSTLSRASIEAVQVPDPAGGYPFQHGVEAVAHGGSGAIDAQLAYLTGGFSWSAEHVLVRDGDRAGAWSSTVTVVNGSGRTYRDATLKLVAGEPNRVSPMPLPVARGMAMAKLGAAPEMASDALSEQTFSEYHLYTLDHPATLRDGEQRQLTMYESRQIKLEPRYVVSSARGPEVRAQLQIVNRRADGLGVPLPAGRVRVYAPDPSGALQFAGEAQIGHTAEGETLRVEVGTAFDLVAERRELYNKRLADREREYAVQVVLRNRKKEDVTIVVEEPGAGDLEVIRQSYPSRRIGTQTLEFKIPVKAGGTATLEYAVRVRY